MITITRSALSVRRSSGPSPTSRPGGFSLPTTEGHLKRSLPRSGPQSASTSSKRVLHKPPGLTRTTYILTTSSQFCCKGVRVVYLDQVDALLFYAQDRLERAKQSAD